MCADYHGQSCNVTKICDDEDTNCDLFGLPRSYWLEIGSPTVDGDYPSSEFGIIY